MGQAPSCTSKGALLLVAAANGDLAAAQEILRRNPRSALYHNFKDRSSPLIQAAARGHFELVQLILETAVMCEGPERAKKHCIDHTNSKRQTALMVACKHGHPDCVEYLVTNGADPLLTDERRQNACLHFAALYGHSECVHKLLGSRAGYRIQGRHIPIAQIPCKDNDETPNIKFIDKHNGWGLTALHIAVFQGSVSTVRALLRHGANLESIIIPSKVENSPIRCAVGSNALHIAALTGNIVMAKLILEAQEAYQGLELRSKTDAAGLKPQEYAQRARNPVLVHLLDERLPVSLLRQVWMNYSLEQSVPPRHQTLAAMLQKLKLMFNLENIAIQANLAQLAQDVATAQAAAASVEGTPSIGAKGLRTKAAELQALHLAWQRRLGDINMLMTSVSTLHDSLQNLCRPQQEATPPEGNPDFPNSRSHTHEAVLDFILSTLITPRTVSAILHAAKKLTGTNVLNQAAQPAGPSNDSDVQHGMALLTTALRAVETCLHAAMYLTNPASMDPAQLGQHLLPTPSQAATPAVPTGGGAAVTDGAAAAPAAAATGDAAAGQAPLASPLSLSRRQQPAGMSAYSSHWSAHLHTLIAQLQWDIGVQRHRRRRQHSQQSSRSAVSTTVVDPATGAAVEVYSRSHRHHHHHRSGSTSSAAAAADRLPVPSTGTATPVAVASSATATPSPAATEQATPLVVASVPVSTPVGRDPEAATPPRTRASTHAFAATEELSVASAGPSISTSTAAASVATPIPAHVTASEGLGSRPASQNLADHDPQDAESQTGRGNTNEITTPERAGAEPGCSANESRADALSDCAPAAARAASTSKGKEKQGEACTSHDNSPAASDTASSWSDDDRNVCSICMDLPVAVLVTGCGHGLCVQCAFQLTVKGRELPCCPFCRQKIGAFEPKAPAASGSPGTAPSAPPVAAAMEPVPAAVAAQ